MGGVKPFSSLNLRPQGCSRSSSTRSSSCVARTKQEVQGDLGVCGPTLAASFLQRGLIDEYRLFVRPIVLGGGKPYLRRSTDPSPCVWPRHARSPMASCCSGTSGHAAIGSHPWARLQRSDRSSAWLHAREPIAEPPLDQALLSLVCRERERSLQVTPRIASGTFEHLCARSVEEVVVGERSLERRERCETHGRSSKHRDGYCSVQGDDR